MMRVESISQPLATLVYIVIESRSSRRRARLEYIGDKFSLRVNVTDRRVTIHARSSCSPWRRRRGVVVGFYLLFIFFFGEDVDE